MAVPFSNLIPARSRVLPQTGQVLGRLAGGFTAGLEQGRQRAAEDAAPDLLLNYLDTQGRGFGGGTLGNLGAATGYVGGQPQQQPARAFDGRVDMRRDNAASAPMPSAGTGVDAGVRLLDQFEGFRATPYEDWSYRPGTGERYMSGMRIGYGQDATGMPGQVSQQQAQAALRQQIEGQYIPSIVSTIGPEAWGSLNAEQQGVLISLTHNYGEIPGRIIPALRSGDAAATAAAIAALSGDNRGVNSDRRQAEAATFAGGAAPTTAGSPAASAPQQQSAPAWSPPTGAERAQLRALMINPATREMGYQLAIQRMTPPAPAAPDYGFTEVDGVLYRTDSRTGQAVPVSQASPQQPDYGFVNVPGVGLVRTNDVAGTADTVMATPPPGPDFQNEEALRDNFRTETTDYRLVQGHFERLQAAAADPSAAGDIAMVFAFMKMLDPGSVVRETEYATAQNAAGVPTVIANMWNRIKDGERLAPEQRADFIAQAQALFGATQQQFDQTQQRYTSIAQQYGMDPNRIFGAAGQPEAGGAAPEGTVIRMPDGSQQIKQNGQWVPYGG